MSTRDFADDSVGAEQAQFATDGCTLTPDPGGIFRRGGVNATANITVAKTSKGPLAWTDGFKQSAVMGFQGTDSAIASALPTHGNSQRSNGLSQSNIALRTGDSLQIAV